MRSLCTLPGSMSLVSARVNLLQRTKQTGWQINEIYPCNKIYLCWGRLDLAVLFTPSTPNGQNKNQVRWNICAGVRQSTPSFEVVQTEQSRDLFQKRWRIIACMCGNILYRLIYSGVLLSAQFYLFMWLFWRTPSTLKIAKSSPPLAINPHHTHPPQHGRVENSGS